MVKKNGSETGRRWEVKRAAGWGTGWIRWSRQSRQSLLLPCILCCMQGLAQQHRQRPCLASEDPMTTIQCRPDRLLARRKRTGTWGGRKRKRFRYVFIFLHMYLCLYVWMCVWEREREKERQRESIYVYVFIFFIKISSPMQRCAAVADPAQKNLLMRPPHPSLIFLSQCSSFLLCCSGLQRWYSRLSCSSPDHSRQEKPWRDPPAHPECACC